MEGVGFQLWPDGGHLGGADLDSAGVAVGVGFGMHGQSRPGGGGADEVDDDLMASQGLPPSVHRDVGEQRGYIVTEKCGTSARGVAGELCDALLAPLRP